jgi:hypothetical protein
MTQPLMNEADLAAAVRRMPWKQVVKMLKQAVTDSEPKELPQVVLDWFELNRSAEGDERRAELDRGADVVRRMEIAKPNLYEKTERAPIGPWWILLAHYLRDGKRWWLLIAARDDNDVVLTSSAEDLRRLDKIVGYAGGTYERFVVDAAEHVFWTWKA